MSLTERESAPGGTAEENGKGKRTKEGRVKWDAEQDGYLISLVVAYDGKRWSDIAACMNEKFSMCKRTSKQCRERWHYCLDLKINHNPWSRQEEATLLLAHMDYGNRWCDVTAYFKGRHNNMIKNRFYSILRKVKNKVHISDYSYQDELELIEMHYLTIVMMNYIRSPIPKEDYKRKRRTDFMHTVVSSISSKMLVVSVLYI
eukprot:TRINITY_DN3395_c0_g1_i3.p1 TRINITY_DN3395_c0_g1~~TRINITY_DN3395_c0_g1_i3.p1  ORF type:complete len:202 (-),score=27.51 TRINITY_DN3395_c0_g1_i3:458-1063(-)